MKAIFYTLLLSIITLTSAVGQQGKEPMLSREEMLNDLEVLRMMLYDTHPAPFAFCTQAEWEEMYATTQKEINKVASLDAIAFFRLINPLLTSLKDIHTHFQLYSVAGLHRQRFIPLRIGIAEGCMQVTYNTNGSIPPGSIVKDINGVDAKEILATLRAAIPPDGQVPTASNRILEIFFPVLFTLHYDVKAKNKITYTMPGESAVRHTELPGWIPRHNRIGGFGSGKENPAISWEFLPEKVALLKVYSFSKGSEASFKKSLKTFFKECKIRQIGNLILDLRDNQGGKLRRGETLMAYLAAEPTHLIYTEIFKSSYLLKTEILGRNGLESFFAGLAVGGLGFGDKSLRKALRNPIGTVDTLYTQPITPISVGRFEGQVYVLLNGLSISTSSLLAQALARQGAILVGEPAGGTAGGSFAHHVSFGLPYSGLTGYISTFRVNSAPGFTLSQDPFPVHHPVPSLIGDFSSEEDKVLVKTLELISATSPVD